MNSQNAKPVQYLSVSDLYNINFTVTDGDTFVRDINLLESAAKRPSIVVFGQEQFPTLIEKAAALMHSLAAHHLFADGNKRTALLATQHFLENNGCSVSWDENAVEDYLLEVAQSQHPVEEVRSWLEPFVSCV
ncbi:MAG: type II toxin-antitoxin system death-on-curing family toxin [Chloroflexota bacterium]